MNAQAIHAKTVERVMMESTSTHVIVNLVLPELTVKRVSYIIIDCVDFNICNLQNL